MSVEDNNALIFHQQNLLNHLNDFVKLSRGDTIPSMVEYRNALQKVTITMIISTDENRFQLSRVLDDINMRLREMYVKTHNALLYYWVCEYKYLSIELYDTIRLYRINDLDYIKFIDNLVYTHFHTDDVFPIDDHLYYETYKDQFS